VTGRNHGRSQGLADEIANVTREPGKDIIAHGGARYVQSLARLGLMDEYRLVIHPLAAGSGLPLFKDLPTPLRLRLVEVLTLTGGTVVHVYQSAKGPGRSPAPNEANAEWRPWAN
jgi:dihydrofolate reductase